MDKILLDDLTCFQASAIATKNLGKKFENLPDIDDDDEFLENDSYYDEEDESDSFDDEPEMENLDESMNDDFYEEEDDF
jgi:hypothetical protein